MLKEHAFNILRVAPILTDIHNALTLLLFLPDYQLRVEKVWSRCDPFDVQEVGENRTEQ